MISRRRFIKIGTLATIGGYSMGLPGELFGKTLKAGGLHSIPPESLANPALKFKSQHFAPFVNTNFRLDHANLQRAATFRLIEVKDFRSKLISGRITNNQFSLFFKSENTEQIGGNIYDISHRSLGEFSLFIAPVTAEPHYYEAIINRVNP